MPPLKIEKDGEIGNVSEDNPIPTMLYDENGPIEPVNSININQPADILDGRKTVTQSGTAERLISSSTPCQYVIIKPISTNTGTVVVGGSTVLAAVGTRRGTSLSVINGIPDMVMIPIDDANKIFVDSTISGEGVIYTILV